MTAALLGLILALTINSVNPTTINSSDDVLTIDASASGLSDKTQYLQVAMTKAGDTANYLGFTKNTAGDWVEYQTIPDLSKLYSFNAADGSWSGQIKAKFNVKDNGFAGPGAYNLYLLKYISSPKSYQKSNAATISANINLPPVIPADTGNKQPSPDTAEEAVVIIPEVPRPSLPRPQIPPISKPLAASNSGKVLSASRSAEKISTVSAKQPAATSEAKSKRQPSVLPVIFGGTGLGLFIIGAVFFIKKRLGV